MKFTFLTICVIINLVDYATGDPYKILGVEKSSTVQHIRRAYINLVREWHPDKSDDPAAEEKFMEIKEAYELLMDPERRRLFDTFGRTTQDSRPRPDPGGRATADPFEDFFAGSGFKFRFADNDIATFHRLSVTTRGYENVLVPKSARTPHLVFYYSDWCFACLQVEPVWRRIIEELEPVGVGVVTVHADNEPGLARRAGIPGIPALAILMDGKASLYKESLYSVQKVVEFVRTKMPYKLVAQVTDSNADQFLSGWADNRVRALLFQKHEPFRLRYLLAAFYHRDRVAFGFVEDGGGLRERYQVSDDQDTLLLFNENTERPVASVSMADIPVQTLRDVIDNNKYLLLPRLSSQSMLDAICPAGWTRPRKLLCAILISQDTSGHDSHRQVIRRFAQEANYPRDRVRFMYIYQERQTEFVTALTAGPDSPVDPLLHIAILWRRDVRRISYEWMEGADTDSLDGADWNLSYNETRDRLQAAIERVSAAQGLSHEAVVHELIDEHAQGLASRILTKLLNAMDYLRDHCKKELVLPTLSVVATLLLVTGGSYFMSQLMKLEEKRLNNSSSDDHRNNNGSGKPNTYQPELRLHEMRAETYNGLVRLLRPGCRTVLLLLDTQSRVRLLPHFHKAIWPYRKNKTLLFAHLNLDKGLAWYSELLWLSLPALDEPRAPLHINPRNCIGTVLSLNGLRKYFCMYHAKHPESHRTTSSRRLDRMTRAMGSEGSSGGAGAFMGFDDDTEESDLSDVEQGLPSDKNGKGSTGDYLYEDRLLDGLPNWLDRLFEGTTQRYFINYWPDFAAK